MKLLFVFCKTSSHPLICGYRSPNTQRDLWQGHLVKCPWLKIYMEIGNQRSTKTQAYEINLWSQFSNLYTSYCWWKKSCTTWDVQNPVYKSWNRIPMNWCRISSLNSMFCLYFVHIPCPTMVTGETTIRTPLSESNNEHNFVLMSIREDQEFQLALEVPNTRATWAVNSPHYFIKVGWEITGNDKFGDSQTASQNFTPKKHLQQFQIILQIMFWDVFPIFHTGISPKLRTNATGFSP